MAEPRSSSPAACQALSAATVVVASDPADDAESQLNFIRTVLALLGHDGLAPLCTRLEGLIVTHKHQQNFCIGGYSAPSKDSKPSITHAEGCDRCTFRRALEDAGLVVTKFAIDAPREFAHPFIECWELSLPARR
eukprot:TRINITY_DN93502_c0_g1_i1.p1 TRINITY_DN93502_c0_g1~~TRINITY_DN93502_c0_g1_i1.p1  ORF type:complete len:151 (-),score=21.22 TRINITY_DN93502_c0_g1_i1:470-874(-)